MVQKFFDKKTKLFLAIFLLSFFIFLTFNISVVSAVYLCTFNPPGGPNPPPSCYRDTAWWCANPGCGVGGARLEECAYQLLNMTDPATWAIPGVPEYEAIDPTAWKAPEGEATIDWCNGSFAEHFKTIRPIIEVGNPAADCNVAGEAACKYVHYLKKQSGFISYGYGYLDIGMPPDPPSPLSRAFDPCSSRNNYLVNFNWNYNHPLGLSYPMQAMQAYEISIYPAAEFSGGPYYVSATADSGDPVSLWPDVFDWGLWLNDGITKWDEYVEWGVRVQDSSGLWSEWAWSDAATSFSFPLNSYPWVDFAWDPSGAVSAGTEISFSDPIISGLSEVYGGPADIEWIFPPEPPTVCVDPTPCDWNDPDPVIYFDAAGNHSVTLEITDLIGTDPNTGGNMICDETKVLSARWPLPKYREVAPIL